MQPKQKTVTGEGNAPREMKWRHHRGGKHIDTDSQADRPFEASAPDNAQELRAKFHAAETERDNIAKHAIKIQDQRDELLVLLKTVREVEGIGYAPLRAEIDAAIARVERGRINTMNNTNKSETVSAPPHYTSRQLRKLPTLSQGQFSNLKIDDGKHRVWLSRMTIADGMPYNNAVEVEALINGVWTSVAQYPSE